MFLSLKTLYRKKGLHMAFYLLHNYMDFIKINKVYWNILVMY